MYSTTARYVARACCLLSCFVASALYAQFVVSPEKPASLVLEPPVADSPGLVRWFGNPETRVPKHADATWLRDGSRLYAKGDAQQMRLQVWDYIQECGVPAVKLRGYLPIGETWAVSPDGKWLCARGMNDQRDILLMFNGKNYSEHWQMSTKPLGHIEQITFSSDSKYLVIVSKIKGTYQIVVLDSKSGDDLHKVAVQTKEGVESNSLKIQAGLGEVILPPAYDSKARISRLDLKTWIMEPVSESMNHWENRTMELSDDSRWLISWQHEHYEIMERADHFFESRFKGTANYHFSSTGYRVNGFEDVSLSPDGATLVVSGDKMHKIIRLSDQSVIQHSLDKGMCGFFSPDGKVFWDTQQPYRAIDAATWQAYPEKDVNARGFVGQIAFSPNGESIAIDVGLGIEVWKLDGQQPMCRLISPRNAAISRFEWKDNVTIYGGDYCEYLEWKLPQTHDDVFEIIPGSKLFDTTASIKSQQEGETYYLHTQYIAIDQKSGLCLLSQDNQTSSVHLRDPRQPGWVRRLNIEKGTPVPKNKVFISPETRKVFYSNGTGDNYGIIHAYNLATDILATSIDKFEGVIADYAVGSDRLIVFVSSDDDRHLVVIDGSTLSEVFRLYFPKNYSYNYNSAISPDGRWLACKVSAKFPDPARNDLMLIDLEKREIVARAPLDSWTETMAFSPDNRHFAVGYNNGLVSIWNVDLMIDQSGPVEYQLTESPPPRLANTSAGPKKLKSWDAIPVSNDGLKLSNGSRLTVSSNGAVSDLDAQVRVGDLYINGSVPKALVHRSKRTEIKSGKGYQMQAHLYVQDMNLHIQRFVRASDKGHVQYVDAMENTGHVPLSFTVSFVSSFGGGVTDLRLANGTRPLLETNYLLSVPDKTSALFYVNRRGRTPFVCAITSGNDIAPIPPRYRWSPDLKGVVSEWTLALKPYEQRQIMHQFHHEGLDDRRESWQAIEAIHQRQVVTYDWVSRLPFLVNIGVGENDHSSHFRSIMRHNGLDAQGWRTDDLGMRWQDKPLSSEGMGTEFGADRLLALWLNQQPASFEITRQYGTTKATSQTHGVKESSPVEGKWTVQRRAFWSKEDACYTTQDVVYNPTQEPVQAFVEMAFVGQAKILALTNSEGRPLWQFDSTIDIASVILPEQFVIIYEGANQPGILFARSSKWSKAVPKLRRQGDRGLFLGYEMTLAPQEYQVLSHSAAPRPMSVFGGVRDAFGLWDSQKSLNFLGEPLLIQTN